MYSRSRWRNRFAPTISRVLSENKDKSDKEIRKALCDAYPLTERKYHPYKIWLDEIKKQRARPVKFQVLKEGERIVFPDAPL